MTGVPFGRWMQGDESYPYSDRHLVTGAPICESLAFTWVTPLSSGPSLVVPAIVTVVVPWKTHSAKPFWRPTQRYLRTSHWALMLSPEIVATHG